LESDFHSPLENGISYARGERGVCLDIYAVFYTKGGLEVRNLARACVNFLKKEDGPTAVEYAIMLALVVTVCIGVLSTVGTQAGR
jgi:pilus assembly protein Flp/PilA